MDEPGPLLMCINFMKLSVACGLLVEWHFPGSIRGMNWSSFKKIMLSKMPSKLKLVGYS